MEHQAVAEAAVVSHPHPVKGECLYCFVTLCDGYTFSTTLTEELKKQSEEPPWARTAVILMAVTTVGFWGGTGASCSPSHKQIPGILRD